MEFDIFTYYVSYKTVFAHMYYMYTYTINKKIERYAWLCQSNYYSKKDFLSKKM